MKKILREPLLHFLLIGGALFALYAAVRGGDPGTAAQRIEVTPGQIEMLKETWRRQWLRPPTEEELKGLIDGYIYEEVIRREALALGLDREDTVIRRRLVQKYEFLTENPESGTYEEHQKFKEDKFKRLASRYEIIVDRPGMAIDWIKPASAEERKQ